MPTTKQNTTIRLSPEDRADIEAKMKEFGFTQLSPFIRFAIQQLPKLPVRYRTGMALVR